MDPHACFVAVAAAAAAEGAVAVKTAKAADCGTGKIVGQVKSPIPMTLIVTVVVVVGQQKQKLNFPLLAEVVVQPEVEEYSFCQH